MTNCHVSENHLRLHKKLIDERRALMEIGICSKTPFDLGILQVLHAWLVKKLVSTVINSLLACKCTRRRQHWPFGVVPYKKDGRARRTFLGLKRGFGTS